MYYLLTAPFQPTAKPTTTGLRSRFGGRKASRSGIEESERESTTPATAVAAAAEGRVYTWQEVAAHNTAKSLWVTVRGQVYDITGACFFFCFCVVGAALGGVGLFCLPQDGKPTSRISPPIISTPTMTTAARNFPF